MDDTERDRERERRRFQQELQYERTLAAEQAEKALLAQHFSILRHSYHHCLPRQASTNSIHKSQLQTYLSQDQRHSPSLRLTSITQHQRPQRSPHQLL